MRTYILLCLLALSLGGTPLAAQGRLDEVRREVRQPPSQPDGSSSPSSSCPDEDEDGFLGAILGGLLVGLGEAIVQANEGTRFVPYPYFDDYPGLLWVPRPNSEGQCPLPPIELPLEKYSGRLLVENGNDFDGLNRLGGQFFLDTSSGFGLRAGYQWLHERLPCGCSDNLGLGDVNVLFRLVRHERFQMHLGLGCAFLSDSRRTDAGINATASFDVFPARPVVISTQLDVGTLGSATRSHARGTVGYLWKRWEFFGGYDFLRIGSVNLQGPVVGARLWF